jgi:hypothetical protein
MSDVSCVIFYAGKMLQTIEFPYVALNINLFEGLLQLKNIIYRLFDKKRLTHNFFIYYPISMNKKTEDMVFHALRSSHKINFFGVIFSSLR